VKDAAEHGRDSAPGPSDLVLDLSERPRPVRRGGKRLEQGPHQVTATVVKARDLIAVIHRVVRRVFGGRPAAHGRRSKRSTVTSTVLSATHADGIANVNIRSASIRA
jgi:hypothetical protein